MNETEFMGKEPFRARDLYLDLIAIDERGSRLAPRRDTLAQVRNALLRFRARIHAAVRWSTA